MGVHGSDDIPESEPMLPSFTRRRRTRKQTLKGCQRQGATNTLQRLVELLSPRAETCTNLRGQKHCEELVRRDVAKDGVPQSPKGGEDLRLKTLAHNVVHCQTMQRFQSTVGPGISHVFIVVVNELFSLATHGIQQFKAGV